MAGALVKYDPKKDYRMTVEGHGELQFADGELVQGTWEGAGPAYLYSLRLALLRSLRYEVGDTSGTVRVQFSSVPEKFFDPDFAFVDSAGLLLWKGRLLVEVLMHVSRAPKEDDVRQLLGPLLARTNSTIERFAIEESNEESFIRLALDWPTKGRTVKDAGRFGDDVIRLLDASDGGELGFATTLDLLKARQWDLLKGQPESDWLDVKSKPYDQADKTWSYELAKDVAAFANSPAGGMVVLGMTARDDGDGEVITGYKEFVLDEVRSSTYRKHVAQRVYPRLRGFQVFRIAGKTKGRGLVVLHVPPQPDSARPFLVEGVVTAGGILGAHVLLPIRREDDTDLWNAAALHARIRLGEQVIEGREKLAASSPAGPKHST
jgi:hypothetical protein